MMLMVAGICVIYLQPESSQYKITYSCCTK